MPLSYRFRTASMLSAEAQETFIAKALAREQDCLNTAMTRGRVFLANNILRPNDLERYEQEFTTYLHRLPAWLPMKWAREQGPIVDLWFLLDNVGTQPATDVRLTLTFPYGSFVTPRDEDTEIWDIVLIPRAAGG